MAIAVMKMTCMVRSVAHIDHVGFLGIVPITVVATKYLQTFCFFFKGSTASYPTHLGSHSFCLFETVAHNHTNHTDVHEHDDEKGTSTYDMN